MKKLILACVSIALLSIGTVRAQEGDRQTLHARLTELHSDAVNAPALPAMNVQASSGRKSVFLASIFSLIVPGAGELYAGGYSRGQYFTIAEGGLWLTYAGFQIYGNLARNDARDFAAVNAGFSTSGKDDQFYVNIGNFSNVYQYNDKKLQDRSHDLVYDPAAGYAWQWNSDANRQKFKAMRISSDNVLYNSRFVIAVVIANHIASAISAGNAAAEHNRALEEGTGSLHWRIVPQVTAFSGVPDGLLVGVETSF